MRIVSIGSHPDDVEFGLGGTLAKHRSREDDTQIILCTLGNEAAQFRQREEEARKAASILGVKKLHMLDYSVFKLTKPSAEFGKIIRKKIEEINPDRVYLHSPFDLHQVHIAVNKSVMNVIKDVKQIILYETISSTTPEFWPDAYVDITKFIKLKLKALKAHKTQSHKLYIQPRATKSPNTISNGMSNQY